jgi:hypothetical protein
MAVRMQRERQALVRRRLEALVAGGFHRALAVEQDMDQLEGLVGLLEGACRGEAVSEDALCRVLGEGSLLGIKRRMSAAVQDDDAERRVRAEAAVLEETRRRIARERQSLVLGKAHRRKEKARDLDEPGDGREREEGGVGEEASPGGGEGAGVGDDVAADRDGDRGLAPAGASDPGRRATGRAK